jgi:hypothetical protein
MLKNILIWMFGTLLVLQLIQIKVPKAERVDPQEEINAPQEILSLLKTSCYDCHSYETKIPWYGHIAPISWEVKSHIKDGREWLNFQQWARYDEKKRQKLYKGITKSIQFSMPMPMYLLLHKDARLSREQRESIKKWAESHIKEEE